MRYYPNILIITIFIIFSLPLFAQDYLTLELRKQRQSDLPAKASFPEASEDLDYRDELIQYSTIFSGINGEYSIQSRGLGNFLVGGSRQHYKQRRIDYETWDGAQWIHSRRDVHNYDSEGRMIGDISLIGTGITWSSGRRTSYAYDDAGNRISWLYEDWSVDHWVNSTRYTSTYNLDGERTENVRDVWEGNQWVRSTYSFQYANTYDNSGNRIEQIILVWDGAQWVNSSRSTYTYDLTGARIELVYEIWGGSDWLRNTKSSYTHDLNGNQTELLDELWDGIQWVLSSRNVATFDDFDNKITSIYENWDGIQWVGDRKYAYSYEVGINRTVRLKETWSDAQWVISQRYTYTFDASGRQTEQIIENWNGIGWETSSTSYVRSYTYDSNGNATLWIEYEWDGFQWVTEAQYIFDYDANGYKAGHLRMVWDGTHWVNSFKSTLTYTWYSPYASFSVDVDSGAYPLAVQFADASSPAYGGSAISSWQWDFDGAGVIDATDQNPIYTFTTPGSKDVTLIVSDGVTADTTTFSGVVQVDFENLPAPIKVVDVPNDQGGRVYINFFKSGLDDTTSTSYRIERLDIDTWVPIDTVASAGAEMYTLEVSTIVDSSATSGYETNFRAVAIIGEALYTGGVIVGYSIDNLAPAPVSAIQASIEVSDLVLTWQASSDTDVLGYHLCVANEAGLYAADSSLKYTGDLIMSFPLPPNAGEMVYVIVTEDIHNNFGEPSLAIDVSTLGIQIIGPLPTQFALHPAYPNPFNPVTTIQYDLPAAGFASVVIYDMTGRVVSQLVNGSLQAGYHSIRWNGRTTSGRPAPSGIYIARLVTAEYARSIKLVLMK